MNYLLDGTVTFNDIYDLYNELFMELGLYIGPDQYLYEQDTAMPIRLKDKFIKATINPNIPLYAGRNDILFEPNRNYSLIASLFCYYLDKCQHTDDGDILQGYIANFIDDNPEKDKQRVAVKTKGRGEISSAYYYNIYLAYIDCIFRIAGYVPNLYNLDIKEVV